jgi:hypothetical protein|tara:strand:+ start:1284 stop:1616 length:333 start_codon:yes stop_codon:yes gene_type:complete
MNKDDLKRAEQIEQQVERWDLLAKVVPTFFLIFCFVLLFFGFLEYHTIFYIGFAAFGITAVSWWFWTLFSIRFLVTLFKRATENLIEVGEELKTVKKEYQELRDEENNRS